MDKSKRMDRAVRTGVVGLGYFGSFHAKHYAANPQAELVGVVDADYSRAEAAAKVHGAQALTDHRALIGKVDAVSITVPTSLHHRVAADFIDAGVHVLVEKPLTEDSATARDLVERAEKKGIVLQVGHIERFSATFAALRRELRNPMMIDCLRQGVWTGRAADVDVVLDLMIHDIDLTLALAASPLASLSACGARVISKSVDIAGTRLSFESGLVASLTASRIGPGVERRIRAVSSEGVILADLAKNRIEIGRPAGESGAGSFSYAGLDIAPIDALGAEISAFLGSVLHKQKVEVDGRAGLAALEIAERIRAEISRPGAGRG